MVNMRDQYEEEEKKGEEQMEDEWDNFFGRIANQNEAWTFQGLE